MFLPGIRAILIFVFNFSRWNKIYLSKKTLPENSRQLSVNSSANYSYYHWEKEKDGVEKCSLFCGYKKEVQLVKYFLSKLQLLSKVFKKLSIFKNYFYLDRYSRLKNIKISINIFSERFKNLVEYLVRSDIRGLKILKYLLRNDTRALNYSTY